MYGYRLRQQALSVQYFIYESDFEVRISDFQLMKFKAQKFIIFSMQVRLFGKKIFEFLTSPYFRSQSQRTNSKEPEINFEHTAPKPIFANNNMYTIYLEIAALLSRKGRQWESYICTREFFLPESHNIILCSK